MKRVVLTLSLILLSINLLKSQDYYFIENQGQWDDQVKFLAKFGNTEVWITNNSLILNIVKVNDNYINDKKNFIEFDKIYGKFDEYRKTELIQDINNIFQTHTMVLSFNNSKANVITSKNGKIVTYFNFFFDKDKNKWRSFVPAYKEIFINEIYDGVGIRYYFDNGKLRFDIIAEESKNLSNVKMNFKGQDKILVENGDLILKYDNNDIKIGDLNAFVKVDDELKKIKCNYRINKNNVSFEVEKKYLNSKVIVDPFIFSSIQGDGKLTSMDKTDLKIDKDKNIYSVMPVSWSGLPMTDSAFMSKGSGIAISKLSSDGSKLIFRTFLGRRGMYRVGNIELDKDDNVVVFGAVNNNSHPITDSAFKKINSGYYFDGFVSKLSSDGSRLLMSSYFGGSLSDDQVVGCLDNSGNPILCGITFSKDLPLTEKSIFRERPVFGYCDGFVAKLNKNASKLLGSSYIVGSYIDWISDVKVNKDNQIIMTGWTYSKDYPTTDDALDKVKGNNENDSADTFITIIDEDISKIIYSTYFGGGMSERTFAMELDNDGNIVLAGMTLSEDFPITFDALDKVFNWDYDGFISKFSQDGKSLLFSTYFGSEFNDWLKDITFDKHNNIYFIGSKQLNTKIVLLCKNEAGEDTVRVDSVNEFKTLIGKICYDYSELKYYTLFGDTLKSSSLGNSIIVDNNDNFYISGIEFWSFPTTPGAYLEKSRPVNMQGDTAGEGSGGYLFVCKMDYGCGQTAFNYPEFKDLQGLNLVNNAQLMNGYIRLTESDFWLKGAMWTKDKVSARYGFSMDFSFSITNGVDNYNDEVYKGADGIAFVLQNNSNEEIGAYGEAIGFAGIRNSLSIEFDMFNNINRESDAYNIGDSSENHIAIFYDGGDDIYPKHDSKKCLAKFENPIPIVPDGRKYFVKIEYIELFKSLQIMLDTSNIFENPVIMTYLGFDLSKYVNFEEDGMTWIGFTAATGLAFQEHNILSWKYCPFHQYEGLVGIKDISSNINFKPQEIKIYPNPMSDNFYLKFYNDDSESANIYLTDIEGKIVKRLYEGSISKGINILHFNVEDINTGIYFLYMISGKEIITKKIISE